MSGVSIGTVILRLFVTIKGGRQAFVINIGGNFKLWIWFISVDLSNILEGVGKDVLNFLTVSKPLKSSLYVVRLLLAHYRMLNKITRWVKSVTVVKMFAVFRLAAFSLSIIWQFSRAKSWNSVLSYEYKCLEIASLIFRLAMSNFSASASLFRTMW